jgi:hypothetical protein
MDCRGESYQQPAAADLPPSYGFSVVTPLVMLPAHEATPKVTALPVPAVGLRLPVSKLHAAIETEATRTREAARRSAARRVEEARTARRPLRRRRRGGRRRSVGAGGQRGASGRIHLSYCKTTRA